jgi:hypothetical protein
MIGVTSPGRGWKSLSSPPCPDRLWGPPSLLSNRYQGLLPWGQSYRGVKLTTHPHLVPRLRMRGAILPLPQYAFTTWCSVKAQGQFYLFLYLYFRLIITHCIPHACMYGYTPLLLSTELLQLCFCFCPFYLSSLASLFLGSRV